MGLTSRVPSDRWFDVMLHRFVFWQALNAKNYGGNHLKKNNNVPAL